VGATAHERQSGIFRHVATVSGGGSPSGHGKERADVGSGKSVQATKADIKNAVEELFHVKVTQVRTQSRVGKPRRSRLRVSHTPSWKKAVVTLAPDSKINFF
jgi:hypothetical protein